MNTTEPFDDVAISKIEELNILPLAEEIEKAREQLFLSSMLIPSEFLYTGKPILTPKFETRLLGTDEQPATKSERTKKFLKKLRETQDRALTVTRLAMYLHCLKGNPRIYIEESVCQDPMRRLITVYCHHKMLSRVRNLDWYTIRPFGLEVFIMPMNHKRLKINTEGDQIKFINLAHEVRPELRQNP